MQNINAKLTDIVATNGDWSPNDTVWFSKRTVDRQFVSLIKDVQFDMMEGFWKIGVSLIDTSDSRVDKYVEKELVDMGAAVFLCV